MTKYAYKPPTPEGKISRIDLAELLGVTTITIINYENRGFLAKGEPIQGLGSACFYDISVVDELKAKLKPVKRKKND